MNHFLRLITAITIVSSTQPAGAADDVFAIVDVELKTLHGKPISAAVDRLELPSRERKIAGLRLVDWKNEAARGDGNGGTMYLKCTVTAQIDARATVVKTEYTGNYGACSRFAAAFK